MTFHRLQSSPEMLVNLESEPAILEEHIGRLVLKVEQIMADIDVLSKARTEVQSHE